MRLSSRFIASLLFLFVAAFSISISIYRPFYNWDMVMYIAAAKSVEEADPIILRSFTYDQAAKSVPDEDFLYMIQGSDYFKTVYTDPSAFMEQLPFYQIHPVYTFLIYFLYKAGVDIAFATYIISGIAVVLAITLLFFMANIFLQKPYIYAMPLLVLIFGIPDLARLSTPDGIAFLAILISTFLFLKQRFSSLLILLPAILFIRTDFFLLVIPLSLIIFKNKKEYRLLTSLSIIFTLSIYVFVNGVFHNPGWTTLFYHAFVQKLSHPISMPPTLTAQEYAMAFLTGVKEMFINKSFLLNAFFSFFFIFLFSKRRKIGLANSNFLIHSTLLFLIFIFYIICHFLAFPVVPDRYFSGIYLIIAFLLLGNINELENAFASKIREKEIIK
jgi:hypothetical protein